MKFIQAINAITENVWAAFILLAGVTLAAFSIGHPDLKEAAATVIGGALIMFRSHTPQL